MPDEIPNRLDAALARLEEVVKTRIEQPMGHLLRRVLSVGDELESLAARLMKEAP